MTASVRPLFAQLVAALDRVLLGKHQVVELTVTTLLAGGHLLLEDLPGVGKTTLAAGLAQAMGAAFQRVQFTADLLPADVLGARIYRRQTEQFEYLPGPIFANVVLADELNRAPPRTQSSLLQAMNEGVVTVDRETHALPSPFMVVATQNPRGHHGTYPLPESQRDRFLMRLTVGYPDPATEVAILDGHRIDTPISSIKALLAPEQILAAQAAVRQVAVPAAVMAYIVRLADASRHHDDVTIPLSPRATISLMRAGQALAFLRNVEQVDIDLVKTLAPAVMAHRLGLRVLGEDGLGEGASAAWVERELLARVAVE